MSKRLSNFFAEKKAKRAEKKAQKVKVPLKTKWMNLVNDFQNDLKEIKNGDAKAFVKWVAIYLLLAFLSVVMTETSNSWEMKQFPQNFMLVLLRVVMMFVFTVPVLHAKRSKMYASVLLGLWFTWMSVTCGRLIIGFAVLILAIAVAIAMYYYGNRTVPCKHTKLYKNITFVLAVMLVTVFIVQMFQTRSIIKPFSLFFMNPDILALNLTYMVCIGSFVFFFRRPKSMSVIYSLLWIALSFVSYVKYTSLWQPVVLLDVYQASDAIVAMFAYYSLPEIIGVISAFVVGILLIVVLSRFEKPVKFSLTRIMSTLLFCIVCVFGLGAVTTLDAFRLNDKELTETYNNKGFIYSFISYAFSSNVNMPDGYESIDFDKYIKEIDDEYVDVLDRLGIDTSVFDEVDNVIVIQVESFVDPYLFSSMGAEAYETDPIPFIHYLCENYTSGTVDVPVFGGSTVKSEFEFITGMNMDYLPVGYNPYPKQILNTSTDSIVRLFKEFGYNATAMHNYRGEFFNRDRVYKNLAFDRYLPMELMSGVQKKPGTIWANDSALLDQLKIILDKEEDDKNFVFTVTVQLHGNYFPIEKEDYTMEIYDTFPGATGEDIVGSVAYYVSQAQEVDKVIADMISYLESREDEKSFVLFYSDHMPTLYADIHGEESYTTQFFTWDNLGLEKQEDKHLQLYELSTYMFDILQLDGIIMNKLQQNYAYLKEWKATLEQMETDGLKDTDEYKTLKSEYDAKNKEYETIFKNLQYYKLYDEHKRGTLVNNPDYEIGILPFYIESISPSTVQDGVYTIKGDGFTSDTFIIIDNKRYSLVYVDRYTMTFNTNELKLTLLDSSVVQLHVVGAQNIDTAKETILRKTDVYEWGRIFS